MTTRSQWRTWLAEHSETEAEVWLVRYKRHTGRPCLSISNAVEEALCFGWIDGIVKRIDEARYAQRFTPRRAGSMWSELNRRRFASLLKAGRVTRAGLDKAPPSRKSDQREPRPPARGMEPKVPAYIQGALRSNPRAWRCFQNLAPSYRRLYVAWIDSAKMDQTRARRLREALALLEQNKKLGLK